MNRFSKNRSAVVVVGIALAATISYSLLPQTGGLGFPLPMESSTGHRDPRPQRSADIDEWMAGIRQAGLHGDRSRIPEIIVALQNPKHPDVLKTALHALSQLGAVETLPAIDALIRDERADPEDRNFAMAARARLVAEYTSAATPDPTTRTGAKISRLQREIGLSGDRLTAAVRSYGGGGGSKFYRLPPAEVYAMRQLADIAYREHYATPNGVPGAEGIDFSQDAASAVEVKLALLPESQRAGWLIQDLAHSIRGTTVQPYEIQLAIDEGLAASRAGTLQLQEMEKHRNQYSSDGFGALSMVMMGIGDKSQLPLLEHLSHDPDPRLANDWRLAYTRVNYGKRYVLENGY